MEPSTKMEGYGTYNMPPVHGRMTAVWHLRPLRAQRTEPYRSAGYHGTLLDWEFHGAYTPFGEAFDEGNTCSNAIYKYRDDHDLTTCGETDEYSNGNGALSGFSLSPVFHSEGRYFGCGCPSANPPGNRAYA